MMDKLMKPLRALALAALVLAPAASLAERISKHTDSEGWEEWFWATSVSCKRGEAHTFWIKGLSENTAITGMEVYYVYKYKEDGETYEDWYSASESCDVVNSSGGFDKYVLLTAEDWEDIPGSGNVSFKVYVDGWEPESTADATFTFGHSNGSDDYPSDWLEQIGSALVPQAVNDVSNETACARHVFSTGFSRSDDGSYDCRIPLWLEADVEYWVGIDGKDSALARFYRLGARQKDLLEDVAIESVTNVWRDCSVAYRLCVPQTGTYILRVTSPAQLTKVGCRAVYRGNLSVNFPDEMRNPICPGYKVNWTIESSGGTIKSLTGLPRGLTATIGTDGRTTVTGSPVEKGAFTIEATVSNGGESCVRTQAITVEDVPCQGEYTGFMTVTLANGVAVPAPLTVSVNGKGELTGTVTVGGKKLKISALTYSGLNYSQQILSYTLSLPVTSASTVLAESYSFDFYGDALVVSNIDRKDETVVSRAYRVCKATKDYAAAVAPLIGTYQFSMWTEIEDSDADGENYGFSVFSLAVDKTGKVSLKGYLNDGTMVDGAGKLAGSDVNDATVIVTGKSFGLGGCAVAIAFYEESENEYRAWIESIAATTCSSIRTTEARHYEFSSSWPYDGVVPYETGELLPVDCTPETTQLIVAYGDEQYAYDLVVDSSGTLKGLGSSTNKVAPKLSLDVRTGLLTGSGSTGLAKMSIYGLVASGGEGRGSAVSHEGACQDVTIMFEKQADVEENFGTSSWTGKSTDNPIYVGSTYSCDVGVSIGGVSAGIVVSGLPKGFSYDPSKGCISGAATKAGTYAVKFTYQLGTKKITRTKTLVIVPLPSEWSGSTYEGFADVAINEGENLVRCPFSASISSAGVLSGSVTLGGKKLGFKKSHYDSLGVDSGVLTYSSIPLDISSVDQVLSPGVFHLDIAADSFVYARSESGRIVPVSVCAAKNRKADKAYAARVAPFSGTYVLAFNTSDTNGLIGVSVASVIVDKTGGVKTSGVLFDGTTFSASGLLDVDSDGCEAQLILPIVSKAFSDGGIGLALDLSLDYSVNTQGEMSVWSSDIQGSFFSLATGVYSLRTEELLFFEPFTPGCWMQEGQDLQTTCLALETDRLQAFYEVTTDSHGKATGIGSSLNGSGLKLKFDAKTGLFSGNWSNVGICCGALPQSCKVFGVLNRNGSAFERVGAGAVVWNDGEVESLNISWNQLSVCEEFGNENWNDSGNPIRVGSRISLDPTVSADGCELPLTITGLPPGLKYSAGVGISGVPTKAGSYAVKISYSLGSKKVVRTETMVIADFPSGITGTYNGVAKLFVPSAGVTIPCPLTATLDNKGALKGTITAMGKKLTFSAAGYDSCDSESGNVEFGNVAFNLKAIDPALENVRHSLTVGPLLGLSGYYETDDGAAYVQIEELSANRDATRDASRSQKVAPFVGKWVVAHELTDFNGNDVPIVASVSVDAKGAVKVSGTFYDGTSFAAKGVLAVRSADSDAFRMLAKVALPITAKSLNDGGWCLYLSWLTDDEYASDAVDFSTSIGGASFNLKSGNGCSMNEAREIFADAYSVGCWFDETLAPAATDLVLALQDDEGVKTACVPVTTDKTGVVTGCSTTVDCLNWLTSDYVVNGTWGDDCEAVSGAASLGGLKLKVDNKTGLLSGTISASASNKKLCCGMSVNKPGNVYGVLSSAVSGDGIRGLAMVVWSDGSSVELIEIGSRAKSVSESYSCKLEKTP